MLLGDLDKVLRSTSPDRDWLGVSHCTAMVSSLALLEFASWF